MTDDGKCTCQPARRTYSRRKEQDQWRKDPRWAEMIETHAHAEGAVCAHCGMKHGQPRHDKAGNPSIYREGKRKGEPVLVVLTINHKTRDRYLNKELYLTWNGEKMEVCCTLCNLKYESGMKPCPKCTKPENGQVTYIKWYDEECPACYFREHPEEAKKQEEGKAAFMEKIRQHNAQQAKNRRERAKKHPCTNRKISGACKLSPIGSQCPYSPTKAPKMCDPDMYAAKKGAKA
nr:hypothetical protein [uncultured Methanoregula sp.]